MSASSLPNLSHPKLEIAPNGHHTFMPRKASAYEITIQTPTVMITTARTLR